MSTRYIVKPGDTLSGIAAAHGLKSYSSIYKHPENAAFRAKRPNPNLGGTRKIAAILVADIVGYSRLAGTDEDRTLSRPRGAAHRSDRPGRL
jgi:class 3 adenylate cyclase